MWPIVVSSKGNFPFANPMIFCLAGGTSVNENRTALRSDTESSIDRRKERIDFEYFTENERKSSGLSDSD